MVGSVPSPKNAPRGPPVSPPKYPSAGRLPRPTTLFPRARGAPIDRLGTVGLHDMLREACEGPPDGQGPLLSWLVHPRTGSTRPHGSSSANSQWAPCSQPAHRTPRSVPRPAHRTPSSSSANRSSGCAPQGSWTAPPLPQPATCWPAVHWPAVRRTRSGQCPPSSPTALRTRGRRSLPT